MDFSSLIYRIPLQKLLEPIYMDKLVLILIGIAQSGITNKCFIGQAV